MADEGQKRVERRLIAQLSGARKAAILLVAVGDGVAREILRALPEVDVQRLTEELAELKSVPPELSAEVLAEFWELLESHHVVMQGGLEFATRLLNDTFGKQRAEDLLALVRQTQEASQGNLAKLQKTDPQQLGKLLDAEHPKLLEELVPKLLTLGEVQRVLEQLLRERVSIRDMGGILEALVETAPVNKGLITLVEATRHSLGRRLIQPLLDVDGQLPVLQLDPALEDEILGMLQQEGNLRQLTASSRPSTPLIRRLADSLRQLISSMPATALPVLLAPSPARYHIKRWIEPWIPRMAVVAASDIPAETRLRPMGIVR